MFNPGLGSDKILVQTRYVEMLEQAADERAQPGGKFPVTWVVTTMAALAIATPIVFWLVWAQMAG